MNELARIKKFISVKKELADLHDLYIRSKTILESAIEKYTETLEEEVRRILKKHNLPIRTISSITTGYLSEEWTPRISIYADNFFETDEIDKIIDGVSII